MNKPARWAAIAGAAAALAACGTVGAAAAAAAAAAPDAAAHALPFRYFAFDINNGTSDPGLIPVAGTSPAKFAQGDELIINDQVTTTHRAGGGYPIVGFDSGVCTLTRIPEKYAEQTIANCVVTVLVKGSSLTVQGVVHFRSQQPEGAVLAVTGGTGKFSGATGRVAVSFTKSYKILTFALK